MMYLTNTTSSYSLPRCFITHTERVTSVMYSSMAMTRAALPFLVSSSASVLPRRVSLLGCSRRRTLRPWDSRYSSRHFEEVVFPAPSIPSTMYHAIPDHSPRRARAVAVRRGLARLSTSPGQSISDTAVIAPARMQHAHPGMDASVEPSYQPLEPSHP